MLGITYDQENCTIGGSATIVISNPTSEPPINTEYPNRPGLLRAKLVSVVSSQTPQVYGCRIIADSNWWIVNKYSYGFYFQAPKDYFNTNFNMSESARKTETTLFSGNSQSNGSMSVFAFHRPFDPNNIIDEASGQTIKNATPVIIDGVTFYKYTITLTNNVLVGFQRPMPSDSQKTLYIGFVSNRLTGGAVSPELRNQILSTFRFTN